MRVTERRLFVTLRRFCLPVAGAGLIAGALMPAPAAGARAGPAASRAGPGRPGRPGGIQPGGPLAPAGGGASGAVPRRAVTRVVASTNWSGYAAVGRTFTRASASWVEPRGSCPGGSQYSSFWVGLDGFGTSTVEQTGTEVDCAGTSARYYSWYEMYPAFPVNFRNPVRPGDHFTGSVTYHGGGRYTLVLADVTRGWRRTVRAHLTGAQNASAEAVAEAPSSATGVLPLANFGTARFSNARAGRSPLGTFRPVRIVMVGDSGVAKDAVSPLLRRRNFTATWSSSG